MSDLISRADAMVALLKEQEEDIEGYGGCSIPECFDGDRAVRVLSKLPTIDIVLCYDCKWFDPSEPLSTVSPDVYRCKLYNTYHTILFFCKSGERRETNNGEV